VLLTAAAAAWLGGCDQPAADYLSAARITDSGFAVNARVLARWRQRDIRLWGYVDHGNLYGDEAARRILGDWWAGQGPRDGVWRFDIKARADAAVGRSFSVHVPNDAGRGAMLRRFAADAGAGRPTRVFLIGRLLTYQAPTQARTLTGLILQLRSSSDILLRPPGDTPAE
jgi:hypothetical protein